ERRGEPPRRPRRQHGQWAASPGGQGPAGIQLTGSAAARPPGPQHGRAGRGGAAPPCSAAVLEGSGARPPLVILHGLFGSHGNFHTVAKTVARRGGGKVLTLDARNHGSSPHSPLMTYEAMSLDVQHLLSRLGITKCILLGHSMGGKTAMTLALQRPDLVERLISVDVSPSSTTAVSEFSAYISAMKSVNIPDGLPRSAARQLADDQLRPAVQLAQLRQFLLTNLVEVEGRYTWRVNLEAISHHLSDIMNFPVFHKPEACQRLYYPEIQRLFPKADIQFIEGAGHIVHQDKFEEFITAILNFLPPP
uniref:sn-1-specific diacylglycerol lipase ABHD11 n=1 Tax=Dromaius novaehollandiae TaxID=8790 RepID=A0A8C4JEM3_DRONO